MALLTTAAMTGLRNYVKRTVSYAKYKMDGSYIQTKLNDVAVDATGTIRISFMIYPKSGSSKVTEVQLYDCDNQLWLSETKNLSMENISEGWYELVKLKIVEVDE